MSQLVVTQPNSFFDRSREFNYYGQFVQDTNPFSMPQNVPEHTHDHRLDEQTQGKSGSYNPFYQYSMPMYNIFSNSDASFSTKFPRAQDYMSRDSILKAFPHLEKINSQGFDINAVSSNAHFYIVRSSNDDNIHKAIKYHLWSTTTSGKSILSNKWKESEKQDVVPEIYLIFSVVNSNHFLGVAKMHSDVKDEETFMYWWEPMKWFGSFQLEWVFIKDIHYSKFDHIKEEAFGSSSFINLKDCTKLSSESGKEVLKIFRDCAPKSDIFGSFAYMDQREDYIRLQRENNTYFTKYFEEACDAYKKDPEGFSPQKKNSYNKKGRKHSGNNRNYFANRRQKDGYYKQTFYTNKHHSSPENTEANKVFNKGHQSHSKEEVPSVSLVEQFGLKTLSKKNKVKKNEGQKDDIKVQQENDTLNN